MFDFISIFLNDPNARFVTAGMMLLGFTAAITGNFTVLRKRALVGDAIAHAALPGIVLAFLAAGGKSLIWLTGGALLSGWAAILLIDVIQHKTKLGQDAALGIVLSGFFAIGMLLLSMLQGLGRGDLSGLQSFLFGQAAALVPGDVLGFSVLCAVVLAVLASAYHPLLAFTFDESFAQSSGLRVKLMQAVLNSLQVLVVVAGLQTAGVVLMAAMLVIPSVSALQWTNRFRNVLLLSGVFGALAGLSGAVISFTTGNLPSGPLMVLSSSGILLFSMLFAPEHGWLIRALVRRGTREQARRQNTLKALYRLDEQDRQEGAVRSLRSIARAQMHHPLIWFDLLRLQMMGKVTRFPGRQRGWALTEKGRTEARRLIRLHRLWERYLTERVHFAPDHVHESAEMFEHMLTPELEERLISQLGRPATDPHHTPIPYEEYQKPGATHE